MLYLYLANLRLLVASNGWQLFWARFKVVYGLSLCGDRPVIY